ncbi:TNF receptor-associated factor 3-like isoform X2 [Haemaphysalis longicornis]
MPHEVRVRGFSELSEGLALDFLHPVPAEVTCSSCHDLVGILWLSPSCDHRFCTRCLEQLLGQASKSFCPVDQAEIFRGQLVEDTSVQDKASQFQVWCSNKEQGCAVTLRICDLRDHLRQCNQGMLPVAPLGGGSNGDPPTNDGASTSGSGSGEPDGTPRCWMADFGCDFQGSAAELEAHEQDWQQHRRLVVTRLAAYRRSLEEIQGERDMLRNQLNEVNASLKGLNLGFEHHCTQTASVQNELRHRVQQLEQRLAQLNAQGAPAPPQVSMAPSEASFASMAPATLSSSNDEMITQADGQFRWLLKEYSRTRRHQRHGTHRYSSSPVFCTGMPGYRLQLRIHLNGMGQSRKGRFMAVQLVLLKGPHDAQLPWPFRHRVTITLVNQTGPQHVSYTINDPSFPRTQGDHTVPYVWQEFVAISDLEASPGLAWNDSLLFELSVTPPAPPPPGLYPPL